MPYWIKPWKREGPTAKQTFGNPVGPLRGELVVDEGRIYDGDAAQHEYVVMYDDLFNGWVFNDVWESTNPGYWTGLVIEAHV